MAPVETLDTIDYYEFLSIPADADEKDISRAYRRTNLKYHPDKFKATTDTTTEQAADKLDLLQKILAVLKDPAERAKYDQSREAKQRRKAESEKYEKGRRLMQEDLLKAEKAGTLNPVNGVKRTFTERDVEVERVRESTKAKMEAVRAQKREREAAERRAEEAKRPVEVVVETQSEADAVLQRSIKVTWVTDVANFDVGGLKDMCEVYGQVEDVRILPEKRKRLGGSKKKSTLGGALVIFSSLRSAKKAVSKGPWKDLESLSWAGKKEDSEV